MRLLELVYYHIPTGRLMESHSKARHEELFVTHPHIRRRLTTDEQVDFLYEKALDGTAKEYREIVRWIESNMVNSTFGQLIHHIDTGKPDSYYSKDEATADLKQIIKQALTKAEK